MWIDTGPDSACTRVHTAHERSRSWEKCDSARHGRFLAITSEGKFTIIETTHVNFACKCPRDPTAASALRVRLRGSSSSSVPFVPFQPACVRVHFSVPTDVPIISVTFTLLPYYDIFFLVRAFGRRLSCARGKIGEARLFGEGKRMTEKSASNSMLNFERCARYRGER